MPDLILASASPRRAELLKRIGLDCQVIPSNFEEKNCSDLLPEIMAVTFARSKARNVASRVEKGLVIGADTIVVLDEYTLGKPESYKEAFDILSKMSGRIHEVITGLTVWEKETGNHKSIYSSTRVWFRELTGEEIKAYIKTGEPMDKAGAYGIQEQGALFVEKIEGCYFNVVGLPLAELGKLLVFFGYKFF